jgi:uncharacterized protein (TIGR02145 family)
MKKLLLPLLSILLLTACQKQIDKEKIFNEKESVTAAKGSIDIARDSISNSKDSLVAAKGPVEKMDVCHYDVVTNSWHTINISMNAWPDHMGHGDVRLDDQDEDGYVLNNECGVIPMGDCNDLDAAINPGATEICNGIDDNCNGQIDEGVKTTYYQDSDEDSYGNASVTTEACSVPLGYVTDNTDCNDNNAAIHPGATEICNGIDDNCNGLIDEGVKSTYYQDSDADSYGNASVTTQACSPPAGYVTNNTDCNDNNSSIHPGATEICGNNIDDNCNGQIDEGCIPTVNICNKVWMQKNLEVTTYRNGDPIPEVTDPVAWAALTTGAWCYYNNDPAMGEIYGKLYNWYAVADPRGLAPLGWHVPTDAEWTTLENCLDAISPTGNVGGKMKETGTVHWLAPNSGATNSSGFTALPGGYRYGTGIFKDIGYYAFWWSFTYINGQLAWNRHLFSTSGTIGRAYSAMQVGFPVRCVKN